MTAVSIVVDLKVDPAKEEVFLDGVIAFGEHVLREEDGCRRFEVLRILDDTGSIIPGHFFVNELYTDLQARRDHGKSDHAEALFHKILPLMDVISVSTSLRIGHDPADLRRLTPRTDTMAERTIIGVFETVDGGEDDFTRIMLEHGRRTLEEEPDCLRFQVTKPIDENGQPIPNQLILNELFADQSAIDRHQAGPRMQPMIDAIGPLLKSMNIRIASTVTGRLANKE